MKTRTEFEVGDVVYLKSGSQPMTVCATHVAQSTGVLYVKTSWMSKDGLHASELFANDQLTSERPSYEEYKS